MNANFFINLEKTVYPTGTISPDGEHLRRLTTNQSTYIPTIKAVRPAASFLPICIPTKRHILKNRKNIKRLMRLAAERGNTFIIFLCSGPARKEDVNSLATHFPDLQWLAIDGPFLDGPQSKLFQTTRLPLYPDNDFDLGEKRNFALQLARAMHWNAIFLLDDDIIISTAQINKVCALLQQEDVSVVGFNARGFPDHSVAMHAHRWVHNTLDSFIAGGALAIKTKSDFVSFFPHAYSEDWLFLLAYQLMGKGKIVWAGSVHQQAFNPFKDARRAIRQEVGDLTAESLYKLALTLQNSGIRYRSPKELTAKFCNYANEAFWNTEINNRLDYLQTVREEVHKKIHLIRRAQAKRALTQATIHLLDPVQGVTGKDLAEWTKAWCKDIEAWNALPVSKRPHKSIPDAFKALSLKNSFIGNIPTRLETIQNTANIDILPTASYLYQGYTMRPRTRIQKKGLWLTQATQQYLTDRGLSLKSIVSGANTLRFDRPSTFIPRVVPAIKPRFTICLIVSHGESIALIQSSVDTILKWVQSKGVCQIVVLVYGEGASRSRHELNVYRNRLTTQLVYKLAGTEVQLRSGIIDPSQRRIDQAIACMLNTITFAYWKDGVNPEHPIFVINSHNELLHLGTLGQFIYEEQQLPYQSLQRALHKYVSTTGHTHQTINALDDEHDLRVARQRLVEKTPDIKGNSNVVTRRMVRRMKLARLNWLEQDDLAYSLVYHGAKGKNSMDAIKRTICMPIEYRRTTDKQMIAREIIKELLNTDGKTAYCIIIYGLPHIPWHTLESYCKSLMKIVAQKAKNTDTLISVTYRLSPGESVSLFKHRMQSTMEYSHWLQNHTERISIEWNTNLSGLTRQSQSD